MLGIVIFTLIPELFHKRYRQAVSLIVTSVACCGLFSCLLHRLYFGLAFPALLEFCGILWNVDRFCILSVNVDQ